MKFSTFIFFTFAQYRFLGVFLAPITLRKTLVMKIVVAPFVMGPHCSAMFHQPWKKLVVNVSKSVLRRILARDSLSLKITDWVENFKNSILDEPSHSRYSTILCISIRYLHLNTDNPTLIKMYKQTKRK